MASYEKSEKSNFSYFSGGRGYKIDDTILLAQKIVYASGYVFDFLSVALKVVDPPPKESTLGETFVSKHVFYWYLLFVLFCFFPFHLFLRGMNVVFLVL